jgi:hypothetical protein
VIVPFAPALATIVCEAVFSPTAKSLNDVMPVACVLVAVRVPTVGALHTPLSSLRTANAAVLEPGSMSAATKLSVAL